MKNKIIIAVHIIFLLALIGGCGNGQECDECGGSHHATECESGI